MPTKLYERGLAMRKKVLGAAHVEKSMAAADQYTQPLQDLVNEFAWGAVWTRPGLEPRIRSMLSVTMLTALNRSNELRTHLRGALNNGATREELVEVLLHAAVYCGFPAAVEGFRIAQEVFNERA